MFTITFYLLLGTTSIATSMRQSCSGRTFAKVGTKEFQLFHDKVSRAEAQNNCREWGRQWLSKDSGNLVSIYTSEEQLCIDEMITSMTSRLDDWTSAGPLEPGYFFGATSPKANRNWIWPNRQKIVGENANWVAQSDNAENNGKTCAQLMMQNSNVRGIRYSVGEWLPTSCIDPKYYICEREINPSLNWGYENNAHAEKPNQWANLYSNCGGTRQSPIDLPVKNVPHCDPQMKEEGFVRNSRVVGHDAQWEVENTGRFIKIKPIPERSMQTIFIGSSKRYYVDYMVLKWGKTGLEGSDHVIGGTQRSAEIFHQPAEGESEIHAVSFSIRERSHISNTYWDDVIQAAIKNQFPNRTTRIKPDRRGFISLLRDSGDIPSDSLLRNLNHRLGVAYRYRGSLPHPPCDENVIWTVYSRPTYMASAQFSYLRLMRREGVTETLVNNFRPVQLNTNPVCYMDRYAK